MAAACQGLTSISHTLPQQMIISAAVFTVYVFPFERNIRFGRIIDDRLHEASRASIACFLPAPRLLFSCVQLPITSDHIRSTLKQIEHSHVLKSQNTGLNAIKELLFAFLAPKFPLLTVYLWPRSLSQLSLGIMQL